MSYYGMGRLEGASCREARGRKGRSAIKKCARRKARTLLNRNLAEVYPSLGDVHSLEWILC